MRFLALTIAVALIAAPVDSIPRARPDQTISRHYTPRDQEAVRYAYVPFDVPAGTTRIEVSYKYDRANGANAVDLGLFEPGPLTLGSPAFRGWSGGAQDAISVGVDKASPGYWPGAIAAGRWHVALGLYKIGSAGVDVEVTIRTSDAPPAGPTPRVVPRPSTPLRGGPAWFAGVMHAHTLESDAVLTPQQLAIKARAEGLDFIVITDHNNTTHQLTAFDAPGLLVITGEEATTPGGHFNVWGLGGARDYVDFRIMPGDPAVARVMQAARARGALISINHPIADCFACTWTHDIPSSVNAIEIGNGPPAARLQAMTMWDQLLRAGRRITAVGESDWHRPPASLTVPSVRAWAQDLSVRAILEAVRLGRVVVMANGTLAPPELSAHAGNVNARIGDELTIAPGAPVRIDVALPREGYKGARVDLVWSGEVVTSAPVPETGVVTFDRFPPADGYLRVHVTTADGAPLAITNPIYVKTHAGARRR
jgi:hypothetical protein